MRRAHTGIQSSMKGIRGHLIPILTGVTFIVGFVWICGIHSRVSGFAMGSLGLGFVGFLGYRRIGQEIGSPKIECETPLNHYEQLESLKRRVVARREDCKRRRKEIANQQEEITTEETKLWHRREQLEIEDVQIQKDMKVLQSDYEFYAKQLNDPICRAFYKN